MAKAEPIKLSNSEIAARLLGFYDRHTNPNTFEPGDVVQVSPGIMPSLAADPERLGRFAVVLQTAPSMRKLLGAAQFSDTQAIFIAYLDSVTDAAIGWSESWRYQKVTPADYRDAGLNG